VQLPGNDRIQPGTCANREHRVETLECAVARGKVFARSNIETARDDAQPRKEYAGHHQVKYIDVEAMSSTPLVL